MILRRALAAVLSVVLAAAPAVAQVRAVPGETASSPLTPALSFSAASGPSLSGASLSAPSISASLTALAPAPTIRAAAIDAAVPLAPAAAIKAAAPLAVSAIVRAAAVIPSQPATARVAAALAPVANSKPALQAASLDALYDGAAPRSGPAAATPEGPEKPRRGRLLSPKNVRRAWTVASVAVPIAAASAILGAESPHFALTVLHWLGQAAYWLATPLAFAFTIPQIHRILARRSAQVSTSMVWVGMLSTLATAVNMAYDGMNGMLYRNLAQAAGFGVMLHLQTRLGKKPGAAVPSKRRALIETAGAALAIAAALFLAGPILASAIPAIGAMAHLLVPIQVLSGFGFTYMMYAQLTKMQREHSAGDTSAAMMWAYLGTKTTWVWSFAMMLGLAGGLPWLALSMGALFIGVCWFAGQAALSRLLHAPWSFLPEKITFRGRAVARSTMSDALALVALSALILALSFGGWLAFSWMLGVPAAVSQRFVMYLLYTVQSLIACLATLRTLRMRASFDKK